MQIIVHYYVKTVHVQDISNVSVADELGLVIEFKQAKTRDYFLEKFQKAEIPIQTIGLKQLSIASTGFTVFEDLTSL